MDGTGGRPSSSLSNEKDSVSESNRTNIKANSFVNTPANETTINDEDDDEEKKLNAVSPTPYANYDHPNNVPVRQKTVWQKKKSATFLY